MNTYLKLELLTLILGFVYSDAFIAVKSDDKQYLPTVMWHGMGDSCCNPLSMGRIKRIIERSLPGIYVYSIKIGDNIIADMEHGFFGNVNEQVKEVCNKISQDPLLKGGFNALGFSQGSQFLRGLIQRCPLPVRNFVSVGGQHQGIFGLPKCSSESRLCEYVRKLLDLGAYEELLQSRIVQAQYWHDPLNEETYRNHSIFIADINNERVLNTTYRDNLIRLSNFVMVKFLKDTMVVPIESEWFGFYAPGQDSRVLTLNQTQLYKEDRLGLKAMDESGKLQFLEVDGDHLQFSTDWFKEQIVYPYLATEV